MKHKILSLRKHTPQRKVCKYEKFHHVIQTWILSSLVTTCVVEFFLFVMNIPFISNCPSFGVSKCLLRHSLLSIRILFLRFVLQSVSISEVFMCTNHMLSCLKKRKKSGILENTFKVSKLQNNIK